MDCSSVKPMRMSSEIERSNIKETMVVEAQTQSAFQTMLSIMVQILEDVVTINDLEC